MRTKNWILTIVTALLIGASSYSLAATLTKGYTFTTTEQVTAAKLHSLVDSATVSAITSSDITDGTVAAVDLSSTAVTSGNITDGTITGSDIFARTITTSLIATNAVTGIELSTNITTRTGFVDLSASTLTLANNSVAAAAVVGVTTSAGAADSGKIPKLNASGILDSSMVVASSLPSGFTSSGQTISNAGLLTLAHGLGSAPSLIQLQLKCVATEGNWSVNDQFVINPGMLNPTTPRGCVVYVDATNVYVRFAGAAAPMEAFDKTTGAVFTCTNAKWELIVKAWK